MSGKFTDAERAFADREVELMIADKPPRVCMICGEPATREDDDGPICLECWVEGEEWRP